MTNASTDELLAKVKATRAKRAEADARLLQAVEALERTEKFAQSRRLAVDRNREDFEAARAALARELAAALAANRSPVGLESSLDPNLLAQQTREENALVAAEDAVSLARGQRELLAVEAKSAEATLATAVDRLLVAEAEAIAVEIERLEAQALALREQLVPLPPVSRPRGQPIYAASEIVSRVLEPPGFFAVSRGLQMASENGPHRQRLLQHGKDWEARRALLIAGDGTDAKDAEEAA